MATVVFHGDLQQFGSEFNLKVETAGEAMRALFIQIKGLRQYICNQGYFVKVAEKEVSEESIKKDFKQYLKDDDVIHVVPEITGAGKFGQIILGAVLIGAAFFTGGASMAAWGAIQTGMFTAGIGMMLGGVSQLLTKMPDFGDTDLGATNYTADSTSIGGGKSAIKNSKSSSFSNLGNQSAEGSCVPIAYGRMRIGSKVISQSIESYKTEIKG